MRYTVGIVTYERIKYIGQVLESLTRQSKLPDEIIIVDDSTGSRVRRRIQDQRAKITSLGIEFRYVHRQDGGNMPGARNAVIELASGEVICFLDDDVVCHPRWLESVDDGFTGWEVAGVGGPALAVDDERNPLVDFDRCAENRNRVSRYGITTTSSGYWLPPEPVLTDRLIGANMAFNLELLRDIGGFDEDYGRGSAAFEETDLMTRIRHRNHNLLYHPGARVDHFEANEGGSRTKIKERDHGYWHARNYVLFLKKNFSHCYRRSLTKLLLDPSNSTSVWWKVAGLVLRQDVSNIYYVKGYVDGILRD